jgi:glycyl-tRNA synthetase
MEMEFFVKPGRDEEWHQYWIDERTLVRRPRHQPPTTCALRAPARRSCRTTPSGPSTSSTASVPGSEWGELEGIANRTDFDLTQHKHSGRTCPTSTRPTNERYVPYVIEPAAGLTRA